MTDEDKLWNVAFWVYLVCGILLAATFTQVHLEPLWFGRIFKSVLIVIVFGLAVNAKTGWFFWC